MLGFLCLPDSGYWYLSFAAEAAVPQCSSINGFNYIKSSEILTFHDTGNQVG